MTLSVRESKIVSYASVILTLTTLLGCLYLFVTRCISRLSSTRSKIGANFKSASTGHSSLMSFVLNTIQSSLNISRIPLFLIVCDTLFAFLSCFYKPVLEYSNNSSSCPVIGPLAQFFSISAFIWATAITSTSFKVINSTLEIGLASGSSATRRGSIHSQNQLGRNSGLMDRMTTSSGDVSFRASNENLISIGVLAMAIVIPTLSALIMVGISSSYSGDYNKISCWLSFKSEKDELLNYYLFILSIYIFPLLIMEIYCFKILYSLWKMFRGSPYRNTSIIKLFSYLVIIIGTKGFLLISRIMLVSRASSTYSFGELLFMAVVYPVQGVGDILIFVINESENGSLSSMTLSPVSNKETNLLNRDERPDGFMVEEESSNIELFGRKITSQQSDYSTLYSSSHSAAGVDDDEIDNEIDNYDDNDNEEDIRSNSNSKSSNNNNNNNSNSKLKANDTVNPLFL